MKLFISLMILVLFLSACGQLQSIFDGINVDDNFLSANSCELPCLYDVTIGMNFDDAPSRLGDHFLTENIRELENGNLLVCVNPSNNLCEITLSVSIDIQTNSVAQIVTMFAPQLLFCGGIYQQLGSPSLFYEINESTNFGTITSYLMFYDSSDIEVVLVPSADDTQPAWIETIWIRRHLDYEQRRTALLAENEQYLQNFEQVEICFEH